MMFDLQSLIYGDKNDFSANRTIYIHGAIDDSMAVYVCNMIERINAFDTHFEDEREQLNGVNGVNLEPIERKPIKIMLNSPGGSCYAGLAIGQSIMTSQTPVHSYTSFSASMGNFIQLVCDLRYIYPTSSTLVHDVSYGVGGRLQEHKESMEETEALRKMLFDLLIERSLLTQEMLDEIVETRRDRIFTAQEMIDLKMADVLINYNEPQHIAFHEELHKEITKKYKLATPRGDLETEYTYTQAQSKEEIDEGFRAKVLEVHGYDLNTETFVETEEIEIDTTNMTEREIMLFDETEEDLEDLIMELSEKEPMLLELLEECETKQDLVDLIVSNDIN